MPGPKVPPAPPGSGELIEADVLEGLSLIPSESIDTILTDPPYGLSFMGHKWDNRPPGPEVWTEALRVLKPGGIALIFGGSRTWHRLAVYIEDSGFILKDTLLWLYGSGFPKSQDISRLIDDKLGADRPVISQGKSGKNRRLLNAARHPETFGGEYEITAPGSPEAQPWEGYKTPALKPAYEPIIMAMKPLKGTYAENALKYGVAGLNIGGARIGKAEILTKGDSPGFGGGLHRGVYAIHTGRYPANIIFDPEAARLLDKASGTSQSAPVGFHGVGWGHSGNTGEQTPLKYQAAFKDKGGASRFFYIAKPAPSERGDNPHPTVKPLSLIDHLVKLTRTPSGGAILDPFIGSGTTAEAAERNARPWLGIDNNPEYIAYTLKRLSPWNKQRRLI